MGTLGEDIMRAVVLVAVLCAGLAPAGPVSAAEPSSEALAAAGRLQDTARVFRNGLRSGAPTPVLERLLYQLTRDLGRLESAHQEWTPAVPEAARDAVATERETIRQGCQRLHAHLDQMALALCSDPHDRARLAALAIEVGRQAGSCERTTRVVRRLVSPT
jgi:hypothetical protein